MKIRKYVEFSDFSSLRDFLIGLKCEENVYIDNISIDVTVDEDDCDCLLYFDGEDNYVLDFDLNSNDKIIFRTSCSRTLSEDQEFLCCCDYSIYPVNTISTNFRFINILKLSVDELIGLRLKKDLYEVKLYLKHDVVNELSKDYDFSTYGPITITYSNIKLFEKSLKVDSKVIPFKAIDYIELKFYE